MIGYSQLISGTPSFGSLYYTPNNNSRKLLFPLAPGATGSILGLTNGVPTWIAPGVTGSIFTINNNLPTWINGASGSIPFVTSGNTMSFINPGSASSTLTIVNGIPTWRNLNFQTQTDGTAITNTTSNTWTGGVFIPANTVQVGDSILIRTRVRKTGTAGTVIVRMYIGTAANISGTLIATSPTNASTTLLAQVVRSLSVKSSTNTESFPSGVAVLLDDAQVSTTAVSANNIDWTVGQWVNVGVQNSALGDTSRTSFIQIEIIR